MVLGSVLGGFGLGGHGVMSLGLWILDLEEGQFGFEACRVGIWGSVGYVWACGVGLGGWGDCLGLVWGLGGVVLGLCGVVLGLDVVGFGVRFLGLGRHILGL